MDKVEDENSEPKTDPKTENDQDTHPAAESRPGVVGLARVGNVRLALGGSSVQHPTSQLAAPRVRSNPSLERRPREAWRPCAAQASRELHFPARRKGAMPRGSPQLER
jgi:hypothetical protein